MEIGELLVLNSQDSQPLLSLRWSNLGVELLELFNQNEQGRQLSVLL